MAKDMFWTGVTFAIIIGFLMLAFWPTNKGHVVVVQYDCRQVVDRPDPEVPIAVQYECKHRLKETK